MFELKNLKMIKTLLSATLVACAASVSAQITFQDVTPNDTVVALYSGDSFLIDFDNDLTPELNIFGLKKDTTIQGVSMTITGVAIDTYGATEIAGTTTTIGAETVLVATLFDPSDVIDASATYVNSGTPSIFPGVTTGAINATPFGDQAVGEFPGQGYKYVGCKFNSGASDMYGWIRLIQNLEADTVIVDSYGYETTGTSINAGDTGNGTVGVQESDIDNVQLNMANGILTLSNLKNADVAIYTLIGKQVFSRNMSGTLNWNMHAQVAGIYLVTYAMNGKRSTEKIVIQ